jgi:hypothetical protein
MENKEIRKTVDEFLNEFDSQMTILKIIYYSLENLLYSLDIETNEETDQFKEIEKIKSEIVEIIKNNKDVI